MTVTYNNESLKPSYQLTREETQELEETGYFFDEENQLGMMNIDGTYILLQPTAEWEAIKLKY